MIHIGFMSAARNAYKTAASKLSKADKKRKGSGDNLLDIEDCLNCIKASCTNCKRSKKNKRKVDA